MALGDEDPLKPDYTIFLNASKKSRCNTVPLRHGHLENYSHWRNTMRLKAITKIQNIFRGKEARRTAETTAKHHAFMCARAIALEDTCRRIAADIWKVLPVMCVSQDLASTGPRLCYDPCIHSHPLILFTITCSGSKNQVSRVSNGMQRCA